MTCILKAGPHLSAERLGLITTMRLDFQRLISGWSPELIVPPQTPVTPPSQGAIDETPIEQENEKEEIEYNVMDIDFSDLNANESNQVIKDMHKYFEVYSRQQKINIQVNIRITISFSLPLKAFRLMPSIKMRRLLYIKWFMKGIISQIFIRRYGK